MTDSITIITTRKEIEERAIEVFKAQLLLKFTDFKQANDEAGKYAGIYDIEDLMNFLNWHGQKIEPIQQDDPCDLDAYARTVGEEQL